METLTEDIEDINSNLALEVLLVIAFVSVDNYVYLAHHHDFLETFKSLILEGKEHRMFDSNHLVGFSTIINRMAEQEAPRQSDRKAF